jgi:5-methylcytosine-specific restriction protein A
MQKFLCKSVGCGRTINTKGYCPLHQHKQRQDDERKARWLLQNTPSHNWSTLYNSHKWRTERDKYLKDNPTCIGCGADADTVDHIRSHRGDLELFWDKDNWQSLCADCHNRKTWAEIHARAKQTRQNRVG